MRCWRIAVAALALATATAALPAAPAAATATGAAQTAGSRCHGSFALTCDRRTETLLTGVTGIAPRQVHWQVPTGTPPAGGWPAVVMFSPSFYSAQLAWSATRLLPAGAYYETATIKALLDGGFAVLTPESHLAGFTFWDTNVPGLDYSIAPDRHFVDDILDEIDDGTFGPVDAGRLSATGMSSGGYMTSRMAVSHAGEFQALAIQSASYATCAGPLCSVPGDLPDDHPPTLFLHGRIDPVVPMFTMVPYRDRLDAQGTPTRTVVDPWALHAFLPVAPGEIVAWFRAHDPGPA
jgi:poly(3-hydroxybutyrate) depolymerase